MGDGDRRLSGKLYFSLAFTAVNNKKLCLKSELGGKDWQSKMSSDLKNMH